MSDLTLPLEPEQVYHIFNRGIDKQAIFFSDEHYRFFLQRYGKYLNDYVETFAYCLLPNHFHLMVRVKSVSNILGAIDNDFVRFPMYVLEKIGIKEKDLAPSLATTIAALEEQQIHDVICWSVSERMRRFLMSYVKAVNVQMKRSGSLMQKTFRRKRIEEEGYFTQLIGYIHRNPLHHGIHADFAHYPWSSYRSILSEQPTKLSRSAVLDWFGGKEDFILFHESISKHYKEAIFWIE